MSEFPLSERQREDQTPRVKRLTESVSGIRQNSRNRSLQTSVRTWRQDLRIWRWMKREACFKKLYGQAVQDGTHNGTLNIRQG